jgi:protein TonB
MKAVLTIAAAALLLACGTQEQTPQASANEVPPKAVELVQPMYPEDARKAGAEGTSIVEVTVGADGVMVRCSLATSSGNSQLDEAALQAVHVSKFAAGTRDGKPVVMKVNVPFRFKLADKRSERRIDAQDVRGVVRRYQPAMPALEV